MTFKYFVRVISLMLLFVFIPHQVMADEIANNQYYPVSSGSIDHSEVQHGNPVHTPNYSDDFYRGENIFPKDTGYIILGVLAIGLIVTVFLVANNTLKEFKLPG